MNIKKMIQAKTDHLLIRLLFKSKLVVILGMFLLFFCCTDKKMDSKVEENQNNSEVIEKINQKETAQKEIEDSESKDLTGDYSGVSMHMHDIMVTIELEDNTHYLTNFSIAESYPDREFNCAWSSINNCSVSINETVKGIDYHSEFSFDREGEFGFNYSDDQRTSSFSFILLPEKIKSIQKERIPFKKSEGRIIVGGETFHYYYLAKARCFLPNFRESIDLTENEVDVPVNTSYTNCNSFYSIFFKTVESRKSASHPYEKKMLVNFGDTGCSVRTITVFLNRFGQVAARYGGRCSDGGELLLEK